MTVISITLALALAQSVPNPVPPVGTDGKPANAMLIDRADALGIASEAVTACERRGERVVALVLDADGRLRAGLSADGASAAGFTSAPRKAAAVLAFHEPTRALGKRLESDGLFNQRFGSDPRYFFHPGGLPLYRRGVFVAVLSVGGGHDQDEACGLEALKMLPWASATP